MPQNVNDMLQLLLRWAHVVAGIIWIGHLYFFNWVNGTVQAKTRRADEEARRSRAHAARAVLVPLGRGLDLDHRHPARRPRLLPLQDRLRRPDHAGNNPWLWLAIVLVILAVGFVVYNAVMKSVKNVVVGATRSAWCSSPASTSSSSTSATSAAARSTSTPALIFGTMMALNVWMVIWPYQKKIITATKDGTPPDADARGAGRPPLAPQHVHVRAADLLR